MKRLFQVNGFFFEAKPAAKGFRDDLNKTGTALYAGEKVTAEKGNVAHVSKGPDHIHFGLEDKTPNKNQGRKRRPRQE